MYTNWNHSKFIGFLLFPFGIDFILENYYIAVKKSQFRFLHIRWFKAKMKDTISPLTGKNWLTRSMYWKWVSELKITFPVKWNKKNSNGLDFSAETIRKNLLNYTSYRRNNFQSWRLSPNFLKIIDFDWSVVKFIRVFKRKCQRQSVCCRLSATANWFSN